RKAAARLRSDQGLAFRTDLLREGPGVGEESIDEALPESQDLSHGERPKREDLDAAGERFRERRDDARMRRSGEEEPAGSAMLLDGELDRPEDLGDALDLVDDERLRAGA